MSEPVQDELKETLNGPKKRGPPRISPKIDPENSKVPAAMLTACQLLPKRGCWLMARSYIGYVSQHLVYGEPWIDEQLHR